MLTSFSGMYSHKLFFSKLMVIGGHGVNGVHVCRNVVKATKQDQENAQIPDLKEKEAGAMVMNKRQ